MSYSHFFEPIWLKFNDLNYHAKTLLNLRFENQSDFTFSKEQLKVYVHFLICYSGLNCFKTAYER